MNLLLVNFVSDRQSKVLAYQCDVIDQLAKHCHKIVVLTSQWGDYQAPDNVSVHVIPVRPWGIPQSLGGCWFVNPQAYRLCREHKVDQVFVHMAKDWSFYLWPTFRLLGLPVTLWYAHGSVPFSLKLAASCAHKVVSASKESCRLETSKFTAIGHGINTDLFKPDDSQKENEIVFVGRISTIKRCDLAIKAHALLKLELQPKLIFIGSPLTDSDQLYFEELQSLTKKLDLEKSVSFLTDIPQTDIPKYLNRASLQIHLSQTNSVDKVVLESLACNCPVLTTSPAFTELLAEHPELILKSDTPEDIARSIESQLMASHDLSEEKKLRDLIINKHDFHSFPERLLKVMNS